jgi:hypothetical protein
VDFFAKLLPYEHREVILGMFIWEPKVMHFGPVADDIYRSRDM